MKKEKKSLIDVFIMKAQNDIELTPEEKAILLYHMYLFDLPLIKMPQKSEIKGILYIYTESERAFCSLREIELKLGRESWDMYEEYIINLEIDEGSKDIIAFRLTEKTEQDRFDALAKTILDMQVSKSLEVNK